MKRQVITLLLLCLVFNLYAKINVDKIDPPFWYAGMKNPELQLMVYGENIGSSSVSIDHPQIYLNSVVKLESNNYLLLYLRVNNNIKPTKFNIRFTQGRNTSVKEYELKERSVLPEDRLGFDASDVLYMLMPDRFANGNPDNDNIPGLSPYKVDRNDPNARHGGDLAGIRNHMDYFTDLGVTALWFTPVLENSMKGGSYHGYATTDYYKVDPRFGTNEEYQQLVSEAHGKNLKIVMDMIFNHCGSEHPWIKDMPSKNWFNNPDYENNFVQTSYKLTPHVDPYASDLDFKEMNDGWFVRSMPDLNQKNPHVAKYLTQNSFWWIEYANIDGIRMDTHPYADYKAMSEWLEELNKEYPNYNVVGEAWVTEPAYTAYWQKNSKISTPHNSNLKSVMDFNFYEKINTAMAEESDNFSRGLNLIYNNFVYDFLYPDPSSVMAFIENHDTDRFLKNGENIPALKQALTLLLTTRRIPQLYYGTEVLMKGTKETSDGYVRKDFPGGWPGDNVNAFTRSGRNENQNIVYDYLSNLLKWRKNNEAIAKGSMKHFIPYKGTYVYVRSHEGKEVMILLNGTDKEQQIPVLRYAEILKNYSQGKDIISGSTIDLSKEMINLSPRQSVVMELQ